MHPMAVMSLNELNESGEVCQWMWDVYKNADDARERMAAGADLLQIYSGFVYRGPSLIGDILKVLRESAG